MLLIDWWNGLWRRPAQKHGFLGSFSWKNFSAYKLMFLDSDILSLCCMSW
jgi:hypothetical protein